MRASPSFIDFILKEWLLAVSTAGLAATSLQLGRLPRFSTDELEVLWILAMLFITVKGVEKSGLTRNLALRLERGRLVPLKLTLGIFFLSMVITNDVALLAMVPLTLLLDARRKGLLVILEALAANAGSALTPFGNPQNLFIYWHYDLEPFQFIGTIAPFSLFFGGVLTLSALAIRCRHTPPCSVASAPVESKAWIHSLLLVLLILTVLRLLPLWTTVAVLAYTLLLDRRSLAIDYALLGTFLCFFGLTDNLATLLASRLDHGDHVFLFSALASQVMSNVPAALLFADFTPHWQALLWGVSVGGFGTLVASLANLIAWRLYVRDRNTTNTAGFTLAFLGLGFAAFFMGLMLYNLVSL